MSKLARDAFNKKYNMPDFKIMGTLNEKISKKLTRLVSTGDKSDIIEIIDSINIILGTRISNISADVFPDPFTGTPTLNQDYENPTGVIFIITNGVAELNAGNNKINMQLNKLYFVNERNRHCIEKNNKSNLIMLSARFDWDAERHGT